MLLAGFDPAEEDGILGTKRVEQGDAISHQLGENSPPFQAS
jgi:hypothetical protein